MDKIPVDYLSGKSHVNAHDPQMWTDFNTALLTSSIFGDNYGVGFVFTSDDPFWFLDIDGTTESPLLEILNGAAVEVSSSRNGLHIIGSGTVPPHGCKKNNLEFYTEKRFVALTGIDTRGSADFDATHILPTVIEEYFPIAEKHQLTTGGAPHPDWNGPVDDEKLIERALKSKSPAAVFGKKASFQDLWEGNQEALAIAFPDSSRDCGYDESHADMALAQHLAFWTGNDTNRIERLMLQSKLMREKWERQGYLVNTIEKACTRQFKFLCDKPIAVVESKTQCVIQSTGDRFLSIPKQMELFSGCVYICDEHKIWVPSGHLFNPDRFKTMYGGYSFPMDNENGRVVRNAWEAATESQAFRIPRAHTSFFKPNEEPGKIITREGQLVANIYVPIETPRMKGDPAPFLNHIAKLYPDKKDQYYLVSYFSAIVQFKGLKFQWAPILQGVEGNGKTLLTSCLAYAVGYRYSHFPNAKELTERFNDWQYGKIFIAVEDIRVLEKNHEFFEALKPMITDGFREVEGKSAAKISQELCHNFVICTNHQDGLRKIKNDRRLAPFFCAQQSIADLKRDGMFNTDYFDKFIHWLRKENGFAIVNEFLSTNKIDSDFERLLSYRAPITSSTETAIKCGIGSIEQEILEAIDQELPGFKGGWVSSIFLDRLLVGLKTNRLIPPNKRRDVMRSLDYDWHPGLKDGRVNNNVLPDGGKPRLYIKNGHKNIRLTAPSEIARIYTEDQK